MRQAHKSLIDVEIRNAIYELCAQDSESHLVPRAADDNDAHMPRNFALAQTNRQIRKEFLPVYRRNVNTTISIRDVNEYTETFLSTSEPVVTALRIMVHEAHHPAVQMHPFISACTRNPGLNVTFEREDPSIYHDNEVDDKLLNNLIAVSRGSHQTPWTGKGSRGKEWESAKVTKLARFPPRSGCRHQSQRFSFSVSRNRSHNQYRAERRSCRDVVSQEAAGRPKGLGKRGGLSRPPSMEDEDPLRRGPTMGSQFAMNGLVSNHNTPTYTCYTNFFGWMHFGKVSWKGRVLEERLVVVCLMLSQGFPVPAV